MSECSCIYVDVDDPLELVTRRWQKAKKQYECCECPDPIKVGDRYLYEYTKNRGKTKIYRTCADCKSVRDIYFCNGWYYEGIWETFEEYVRDANGEVICDGVADLTPGAKDKVFAIIEEEWKRWDEDEEEDE
jgi:hypothetical protein